MARMRTWIVFGLSVLLLAVCVPLLAQEPCTITVQPGESIQAAIDAAPEGAVICLAAGEWEENLVIEKSLTLRAAGIMPDPQAVIRSAQEGWPVIRIASEEPIAVTIQGLKITGAFGGCDQREPEWICGVGISTRGRTTVTIEGNTILLNIPGGIVVRDSSRVAIENNTISGSWYPGISVLGSAHATIARNTISVTMNAGIAMQDSSNATIVNNTISDTLAGITVEGSSTARVEDNVLRNTGLGGIVMGDYSQAVIENNTISSSMGGIMLAGSAQATIIGNAIQDNEVSGVLLMDSPCFPSDVVFEVFTGHITGRGNSGGGNADGDYCPETLAFLFTEEGGELDRRE